MGAHAVTSSMPRELIEEICMTGNQQTATTGGQWYISGIVHAAEYASKAAPVSSGDLMEYLNRCSFDLFNTVMFGELTKAANLDTATEENRKFCIAASRGVQYSSSVSSVSTLKKPCPISWASRQHCTKKCLRI